MAKHLKKFVEVTQYESYISGSPILPNVSLIVEDNLIKINPLAVTSITIDSFSYTPETIEYTGGTATPVLSYTMYYNDGTSATTGGVVTYVKNSGVAEIDSDGVLTWTANHGFTELTTNVTVTVSEDNVKVSSSANSKEASIPVVATSITVNSFNYNPTSVHYTGGTATPIVTYTVGYNDGHTESTGGSISYVKNSGVATMDSSGILTYTANTTTGELTTNVTVTVTINSLNDTLSVNSEQEQGHCVGDICYWDGSKLDYIPYTSWSASLGTALAVCIIPTCHNVYGNIKAGFISVKGITSAGTESSSNVSMAWGGFGTDTPLTNHKKLPTWNNKISGSTSSSESGYISSDKFTAVTNVIDTTSKYEGSTPYIPSPYAADGSFYDDYKRTITGNNALSDFSGATNTSTLALSGSTYRAAYVCNKYSTSGIPAGSWYLPALGELAYIMPRLKVINAALTAVDGVTLSGIYWGSTEFGSDYAYYVNTVTGCFNKYYDKSSTNNVRPAVSLL